MKNPCKEYHVVLEVLDRFMWEQGRELMKKSYILQIKNILLSDLENCMRI